jgi:hypothetical protein
MEIGAWVFGLLAIGSLVSVAAKRPWTLVFARIQNSPEVCRTDLFRETNMILSCVWSLLFAGGALLATLGPPWLNLLYGGSFGLMGYYSKRLGSWYSSYRLKSMARSNGPK